MAAAAERERRRLSSGGGTAAAEAPAPDTGPCQQQQQPLPEPLAAYASRRGEVLAAAATVFADADDAFASLGAVKSRLESFKAAHPRDYGAAYLSDSAAALLAPFVRLQLLSWEPLPLVVQPAALEACL